MRVLLVAHVTEIPGPVQSLARFFESKKIDFYKMYFPIEEAKINTSSLYRNKKLLKEKIIHLRGPVRYLIDFFNTFFWLREVKLPIDKALGTNCLSVFPLILFRRMFGIGEVIFFGSDYARRRFSNKLLNFLYITLDRFCAKRADKVCCNSLRTIEARIKEGIKKRKIIYTPNGVFLRDIGDLKPEAKKFVKKILFIGHLSRTHGLQEIIVLLPHLEMKLDIIGSGPYEDFLKRKVNSLGLERKVNFLGFKPHSEVIAYLKKFSGFGLAPYLLEENGPDWVKYCDPVKVKEYLACLVPIIISNVPEIAMVIKERKMGFVYSNSHSLKETIGKISKLRKSSYDQMLENIFNFRKNFDLRLVYEQLLSV